MLLSVLIPSYNSELFIEQAINSVINQKFQDFEIICCDNCSEDSTFDILQEYQRKDSRIKVYRNEKNLGPVLNWKNCLDRASGEYIHWLWSDDWIEENFYIDALDLMLKDGTNCVSAWNYRRDGSKKKYISWQFSFSLISGAIAARKILLSSRELPLSPAAYILPADLVRKHFYTNIPRINETLDPVKKGVGVDSLMIVGCCVQSKNISILQKPSANFRQHENLSVQLNKEGTLSKMYVISHIWFLKTNELKLNAIELFKLSYSFLRAFKTDSFKIWNRVNILTLLFDLGKILALKEFFVMRKTYKSKKAVFK